MSLTLKAERRLKDVGLITLFDKGASRWKKLAKETYAFVKAHVPEDAVVRPDDVALALVPLLEVNEELDKALKEKKLKEQYWIRYFADLILERTWSGIS